MLTDNELITQTINGDQRAYGFLISRYQDYMYTVCYNILKTKQEAEEATQDTFIKAYKKLNSYKDDSKFSSWLYKIAYRTSLDFLRKRKQTTDLADVEYELSDRSSDLNNAIHKTQMQQQLSSAIMQLNSKEAGLIRMFYLEEMSVKELAKSTGMTMSNIKVLLFRARKKLAVLIKEHYTELENYTLEP